MKSLDELSNLRNNYKEKYNLKDKGNRETRVIVGMATCGITAGAKPVFNSLENEIKNLNINNVMLSKTGCIGLCKLEPIVEVYSTDCEKVTYIKVTPEKAVRIINEHIINGNVIKEYTLENQDIFSKQRRIALSNCGIINPELIDEYIALDGYQAIAKVLSSMTPIEVINEIKESGLRGRGGGGFPTGTKWEFAMKSINDIKYVCCNADEGDPGAFMDRSVLEGDPHVVLEAMTIAGYAIGAHQGYIYVRAEYPTAIERLDIAIKQAREAGLLGKNILDSGFDFDIELRLGSGAFVCGEETALMTSIEGNRGEPRPRPPFPAVKGLFAKPTILNNVETFANIPRIILKGSKWFSSMGTEKSKGTKVFCLVGKVENTGLIEIPMGTTLKEIIDEIGGGIPNGKKFKAAQTGGPSGGCIPASLSDIKIDYDSLIQIGAMMGSGGMIVMDEDTCMVDIAKFFLNFTVDESCGKCTACRIGTKRLYEMLEKITDGQGTLEDLDKMERLCYQIKENSLCALGQTAPNPVLSTMKYFKDEYIAHVKDKKCPAGVCKNLLSFTIDKDSCIGCTRCSKGCPVNAIIGSVKVAHEIDNDKCIKCGACYDVCKFNAVRRG